MSTEYRVLSNERKKMLAEFINPIEQYAVGPRADRINVGDRVRFVGGCGEVVRDVTNANHRERHYLVDDGKAMHLMAASRLAKIENSKEKSKKNG